MTYLRLLALTFVLALTCSAARADTIKTFSLSGAPNQGSASLSGTIKIDVTKGFVVSEKFTLGNSTYSGVYFGSQSKSYYSFYTSQFDLLKIMTSSLINYTGGAFVLSNGCSGYIGDITGQPSLAATPEPSSIALLGTGLVGLAATLRRRHRMAQA